LWEHLCEDKRWCPSCSIEVSIYPVVLEEGSCPIYPCFKDEGKICSSFVFSDDLSDERGEEEEAGASQYTHLTDSSILTCYTRAQLVSIKRYAIEAGLIGLCVRADAMIRSTIWSLDQSK
jgi:hypothetical protein